MDDATMERAYRVRRTIGELQEAIKSWETMTEPDYIGVAQQPQLGYRYPITTRALYVAYRQGSIAALHEALQAARREFEAI